MRVDNESILLRRRWVEFTLIDEICIDNGVVSETVRRLKPGVGKGGEGSQEVVDTVVHMIIHIVVRPSEQMSKDSLEIHDLLYHLVRYSRMLRKVSELALLLWDRIRSVQKY